MLLLIRHLTPSAKWTPPGNKFSRMYLMVSVPSVSNCILCVYYVMYAILYSRLSCLHYSVFGILKSLHTPCQLTVFLFLLIYRDNVYLLVICSLALLFSFLSVPGEKIMFLYCTNQMNKFSLLFIAYSSHQSYCSKAGLGWCIWAEKWRHKSCRRGAWKGFCQAFAFCLIVLLNLL